MKKIESIDGKLLKYEKEFKDVELNQMNQNDFSKNLNQNKNDNLNTHIDVDRLSEDRVSQEPEVGIHQSETIIKMATLKRLESQNLINNHKFDNEVKQLNSDEDSNKSNDKKEEKSISKVDIKGTNMSESVNPNDVIMELKDHEQIKMQNEIEKMSDEEQELTFEERYLYVIDQKYLDIIKRDLYKIYTKESADKVYIFVLNEHKRQQSFESPDIKAMFTKQYRWRTFVLIMVNFFREFTGIKFFNFFGVKIFEEVNGNGNLLNFLGVCAELVSIVPSYLLGDRMGRKWTLQMSTIIMTSMCFVMASFVYSDWNVILWLPYMIYINCFGWGLGGTVFTYYAEVLPPSGCMFGSSLNWVFAAAVGKGGPLLSDAIGAGSVMLFFGICCFCGLMFMWAYCRETKDKTPEEIEEAFNRKQCYFWK